MDAARSLREARRRAGLTQAELALRAGTSQAAISAYESGRKAPSVDTFSRLLAATGSRLAVEAAGQPVREPKPEELARASRALLEVLALAEALPTRHERGLRFPHLSRRAA
jgi:transcriptional regulator with XRE-family HTH domain